MKMLYNKKGQVHPSPPPPTTAYHHLSVLLPATILTLAAALSPEDKLVLAYLLSRSGHFKTPHTTTTTGGGGGGDHPPSFDCNCFNCYSNFWVRWDASANRQIIHDIIEKYEEGSLFKKKPKKKNKNKNKKRTELGESESAAETSRGGEAVEVGAVVVDNNGSLRKMVGFFAEKMWSVWQRI